MLGIEDRTARPLTDGRPPLDARRGQPADPPLGTRLADPYLRWRRAQT